MSNYGYTLPMELKDTRKTEQKADGSTGQRAWLCKWEDRNGSWVPVPKKSKYSDGIEEGSADWEKRLVCTSIKRKGVGAGKTVDNKKYPFDLCQLDVYYAETMGYDSDPSESIEGGMRVVEVGGGRHLPDGTPLPIPIYQTIPTGTISVSRYFISHPLRKLELFNKQGKVNKYAWRGFPPETVRFDYASIDTDWDESRKCYMDSIVFRFTYDAFGHNRVYLDGEWVRPLPLLCPLVSFNSMLAGGW